LGPSIHRRRRRCSGLRYVQKRRALAPRRVSTIASDHLFWEPVLAAATYHRLCAATALRVDLGASVSGAQERAVGFGTARECAHTSGLGDAGGTVGAPRIRVARDGAEPAGPGPTWHQASRITLGVHVATRAEPTRDVRALAAEREREDPREPHYVDASPNDARAPSAARYISQPFSFPVLPKTPAELARADPAAAGDATPRHR
jgi:hypothetical protein